MAYIVMAPYSYGLYSYGIYSHCLYSYGRTIRPIPRPIELCPARHVIGLAQDHHGYVRIRARRGRRARLCAHDVPI